MSISPAAFILASMGKAYNPQGVIASSYFGLVLYSVAGLSMLVFVLRMMRRRREPQRSFSPDLALAFVPLFCATAYLVLGLLRILEVSSRVQINHAWLKQRLGYDLRPLGMALAATGLMLLLMLLVKRLIRHDER